MSPTRRLTLWLILALAGLGAFASSAAAFAPIEGVWEAPADPGSELLIQEVSPEHFTTYVIRGGGCTPDANGFIDPVGVLTSEVIGSGLFYSGVDYAGAGCGGAASGSQIKQIVSTEPANYRMVVCDSQPGAGPPRYDASFRPTTGTTVCEEVVRVRPPEPPVTFAGIVTLHPPSPCSRAGRRGRILRLKLRDAVNEPLLSAKVKIGSRPVLSYAYPAAVPSLTKVRLPAAGGTLTVVVTTTSGKSFKRRRHFGPCRAVPRRHRRHHR
jgi:hypothetical protein